MEETVPAVAEQSANVALTDANGEVQNTPLATAADGALEEKQVDTPKTFTQAEVDALVQKRLLKEERRVHRRIEQQLRESQQAEALKPPTREAYRDDDAYLQAQVEHLAERKAAEKLEQRARAQEAERRQEAFLEKAEKVAERYPDFQAVVSNPTLSINDAMAEFIADSDHGADLAYHLGKNPMKAAQIAQMSPIKAARELSRIESELSQKQAKPVSKAPAPISPISGVGASSKEPSEMTDAEFAKWRKSQIAQRNSR
jgi:hypothetical protein